MKVFVLNGWAAGPQAWSLCHFRCDRIFSYVETLDGITREAIATSTERVLLVGWSMGGSAALEMALAFPEKIAGLVLLAATARMMEEKSTDWKGMSERRRQALKRGLLLTEGQGFGGITEGVSSPYLIGNESDLDRGLDYLARIDVRERLQESAAKGLFSFPVAIFQGERDCIVRPQNAAFLKEIFPWATVAMIPEADHPLPIEIPMQIDAAVETILQFAKENQRLSGKAD